MRQYRREDIAAQLKTLIQSLGGQAQPGIAGGAQITQGGRTVTLPPTSQPGISRTVTSR